MSKRAATAAERRHLGRVAKLPCALGQLLGQDHERAEVHHIRAGQGMSERASHFLTVPLCGACHRGGIGVHGDQTLLRIARVDELDLLAHTIRELSR